MRKLQNLGKILSKVEQQKISGGYGDCPNTYCGAYKNVLGGCPVGTTKEKCSISGGGYCRGADGCCLEYGTAYC